MIGRSSWVDSFFVWFPAAWMPLVVEAIREKSFGYCQSVSQLGAVAFTDPSHIELPEALEFTYKVKRWQADARGCCLFFFEQCCARHYNCGSHEAVPN